MTNFKDKSLLKGLGVTAIGKNVFLYYTHATDPTIFSAESSDGLRFTPSNKTVSLSDATNQQIETSLVSNIRISHLDTGYFLTYTYSGKNFSTVYAAKSPDLLTWKTTVRLPEIAGPSVVVPKFQWKNQYALLAGDENITLATSPDLKNWKISGIVVSADRYYNVFDKATVSPATAIHTPDGILLIYYVHGLVNKKSTYALGSVMLDAKNPSQVIWHSENAIWEQEKENDWSDKDIRPLGVVYSHNKLISYWDIPGVGIFDIMHAPITHLVAEKRGFVTSVLHRFADNPILKPLVGHFWESRATFNPTAVLDKGKVHLIYRAIGDEDVSVLGYASSTDGTHIDERLPDPMFEPFEQFELSGQRNSTVSPFMSGGGGYGGSEDPRITKIGDRLYLTYVAYNGWAPPRVALTSISEEDFHARNWRWEKSVLISPPNVVDKNACLFPEKIEGKYVFLHRIFPNMLVDFVDDINSFDGKTFLKGEYAISPRWTSWDSRKIGAGAPPIKTPYGWLVIYHAVGESDPGRYKIGAMLLDLKDPTKVIARSRSPILSPDVAYENEGHKSGVVYPCGAVVMGEDLLVYYGGADSVTCVARVHLFEFLDNLISDGSARFQPISLSPVS